MRDPHSASSCTHEPRHLSKARCWPSHTTQGKQHKWKDIVLDAGSGSLQRWPSHIHYCSKRELRIAKLLKEAPQLNNQSEGGSVLDYLLRSAEAFSRNFRWRSKMSSTSDEIKGSFVTNTTLSKADLQNWKDTWRGLCKLTVFHTLQNAAAAWKWALMATLLRVFLWIFSSTFFSTKLIGLHVC